MKSRVKRMHHLIEGILHYSRAGKKRLEEELPVDVNHLIKYVLSQMKEAKNVKINIPRVLPFVVFDEFRLSQVFQNLILNAIEHNSKSQPEVEIAYEENETEFIFYIKDNGNGIPKRHHEKIFNLFHTMKSDENNDHPGVGLAIVRKTIESAGGEIWVESQMGKGSVFYFSLPKRKLEEVENMPSAN